MLKKVQILLLHMVALFCAFPALAQQEDVMFQAFDWNVQNQPAGTTWYQIVNQNLNTIKNAGIGTIWMPPPSNSAAPQGYLPRELYNFNTAYGTETQLRTVINTAHGLQMKVLSDIVVNHRVGSSDAVTFTNPAWPTTYIVAGDEGPSFVNYPVTLSINGDYFPGTSLKSDNSSGGFAAARDLDHRNPAVRQAIKDYLLFLKNNIGFDGWRYDFVHGYDPIYNKEYNDATQPYFAVSELLESSRVQLNNFLIYSQFSSSMFDFNTKVALQNAIRWNSFGGLRDGEGKAAGLIGWNAGKSVTFLDNHDTGERQVCCGTDYIFPSDEVSLRKGYAYILTHPGIPMVFWTHFFDKPVGVQNAIRDIIAIRKDMRISATSGLSIDRAENGLYAAYINGINGTIAVKIGNQAWSPNGTGWILRTTGTDYAIWTKANVVTPPVPAVTYKVRFQRPTTSWGATTRMYLYNTNTNATLAGASAWPGQTGTAISGTNWVEFNVNVPSGVNASNVGIIFNDGATNQTVDLFRSTAGWFKVLGTDASGKRNGIWSDDCPDGCSGSTAPATTYTVRFQRPTTGWGTSARIYLYNSATNATLAGTTAWPGQTGTQISGTSWFEFPVNVPSGVTASNVGIIFNDGATNQTVDLFRSTAGWFKVTGTDAAGKRTGTWTDTCPDGCSGTTPPPATYTVYFERPTTNWGTVVRVYLFNSATNAVLSGTAAWPGQNMTQMGTSAWFQYTITVPSGVSASNIRQVFNNGAGTQTVDLARSTTGWFRVTGTDATGKRTGTWSASCPGNCPTSGRGVVVEEPVQELENASEFKVYPNPFENELRIEGLKVGEQVQVLLYDTKGNIVFKQENILEENFIQLKGNYASGVYILKVVTTDKVRHQRIMKK